MSVDAAQPHRMALLETGITGLDQITFGGLPIGRTTMITGTAGSGKTVMAIQFVVNGIIRFRQPGVICTFEETPDDFVRNVRSLGWDLQAMIDDGRLAIVDATEIVGEDTVEADLAHLHAGDGESDIDVLGSTRAYVRRLREFAATSPVHFIAHHYVRYLGDLSGGQAIGRALADRYALTRAGTAFYRFDEIPDPRGYKIAYRRRLDTLDLTDQQAALLVDEARRAFRHNTAIFVELAARYPAAVVRSRSDQREYPQQ